MCDYPFFIPQVVLFANSSLFWFKVTNEHREFRNYLVVSLYRCYYIPKSFKMSIGFPAEYPAIPLMYLRIYKKNPLRHCRPRGS